MTAGIGSSRGSARFGGIFFSPVAAQDECRSRSNSARPNRQMS